MKTKWFLGLWLGFTCVCPAAQILAEYNWQKLGETGQLLGGMPTTIDGRSALKITNTNRTALQAQLFKILKPPVSQSRYAIVGEVKYEGVQGDGYLELWNYFPPAQPGMPEGAFFSRTLGISGEMGRITGSSDWRRFSLPFDRTGTSNAPTRLELNLLLPGQGTVWLGPVQLVEFSGTFNGAERRGNAWWPNQASGLIAGLGGAVLGCLGGLLSWLAVKGKCRSFVLSATMLLIVLGGALTSAGLVALGMRQPSGVWFPLLLLGGTLLMVLIPGLRRFKKQYEDLELRRIASMDTLGT
jgi:hypothetical protein